MSDPTNPLSRRGVLKFGALALITTPVLLRTARAAELPQLSEDDPTAKALGYKHDTTLVDPAKFPNHKADQNCANCKLIQGEAGVVWRPCLLFPGKAVHKDGWCAGWIKMA